MNLHKAVQVLHRSKEFTKEEIEEAHLEILDSRLSDFFKNYYDALYRRIKEGKVLPC